MKPTTPHRANPGNHPPTEHTISVRPFVTLWITLLVWLPVATTCLNCSTSSSTQPLSILGNGPSENLERDGTNSFLTSWPKFRGDLLNTGHSTSTAPHTPFIAWSKKIPGAREFWSSPSIFKDRVYVGNSNGNLYCLNATTGDLIWTFYGNSFAIFSSPALADDMVFFGAADRKIYALPAADPNSDGTISETEIIWDYTVGPSTGGVNNVVPSSPAIKDGKLFLGAIDQYFYCFNATNGQVIWKTWTPYRGQHAFSSSPALYKGKVFAATGNQPGRESSGRLYCFSETSGRILWEFDIDDITYSSPVIDQDNDRVVTANSGDWIANAGNRTYRMYSLAIGGYTKGVDQGIPDSHSGNSDLAWSYNTRRYVYSSPAVHDGRLYFGGSDGNLRCVEAKTGQTIWVYETPTRGGSGIMGSPAVAEGMVFVGTADGRLVAVPENDPDSNGVISPDEIVWSYEIGGKIVYSPAIANGAVFIGSRDGVMYCFRTSPQERVRPLAASDVSQALADGRRETRADRPHPIYFTFGFHWDFPVQRRGDQPARESVAIRRMTDLLERHGLRAHYGFVGAVAQQLAEDFPETVAKMRNLKIAVGYHGGTGHNPRGPHGDLPDVCGLSPDEAMRARWTFETRALFPNAHAQAGQPMPTTPGGWLAIQTALGVTPLQTDAAGRGALYEALGAGYPMSTGESPPYIEDTLSRIRNSEFGIRIFALPGLHEIHVYGERRGVPPTYYGWEVGEYGPVTVGIEEWLSILSQNAPRDRGYVTGFLSHSGVDWDAFERLVKFLKSHDEFRITAPDPEGWQWKPENSPLAFYEKRYGVKSLAEVMNLPPPLEELRPRFKDETTDLGWRGRPRMEGGGRMATGGNSHSSLVTRHSSLSKADILLAADYVLSHWPRYTHDGDFGGPPALVELDPKRIVSLAEAFQAFVRSIDEWRKTGTRPESVALKPLRGPIDFPTFKLDAPQTLDHRQRLLGYTPRQIPRDAMPDPRLVEQQGLPACGDFHIWIQTHTKADADDVMTAVKKVAESMTNHVPGVIRINLLCHTRRGQPDAKREVAVNPAEFLYGLAQQYRALATRGKPNAVVLVSMKVTPQQVCRFLLPFGGNRFEGFIHRGYLSPEELDAAWRRPGTK